MVDFFRFIHRKRVIHIKREKGGPRLINQRANGSTYTVDIYINRRINVFSAKVWIVFFVFHFGSVLKTIFFNRDFELPELVFFS